YHAAHVRPHSLAAGGTRDDIATSHHSCDVARAPSAESEAVVTSQEARQTTMVWMREDDDELVASSSPCRTQRSAAAVPGETELHKTLKKEACRWLYRMGYRCIAAEVRLRPLGIIDAVGSGVFRPYYNYLAVQRALPQVCFVECKASRAD